MSSKQTKPALQTHTTLSIQQQEFNGPLPHPAALEGYERIVPGAAERIMGWAEAEAAHRRQLEDRFTQAQNDELKSRAKERVRGQYLGFFIVLFTVGCGTYAAVQGSQIAGAIIGCTGLTGLVSVFILGSNKSSPPPPTDKPVSK